MTGANAAMRATPQVQVWYDGGCPLCIREIQFMRRLDRQQNIAFIDLAAPGTTCPLERELMLARFHAREGTRMLSGAAAFAAMWRAIPGLRPLGLAAENRTVLWGLEVLYRGFLRIRPHLQRWMRASR